MIVNARVSPHVFLNGADAVATMAGLESPGYNV